MRTVVLLAALVLAGCVEPSAESVARATALEQKRAAAGLPRWNGNIGDRPVAEDHAELMMRLRLMQEQLNRMEATCRR